MASPRVFIVAAAVFAGIAVAVILRSFDLPYPFVSAALSGIAAAILTSVLIKRSDLGAPR
jgi:hypothetical protein